MFLPKNSEYFFPRKPQNVTNPEEADECIALVQT